MFRCQICNQVASPGTRATKVTVVSREKVYASRGGGDTDFRGGGRGRFGPPSKPKDKGGKGFEIVQELMACTTCAAKHVTHVVKAPPEPEPVEVVEEATAEGAAEAVETATETTETATETTEATTDAAETPAADAPAEEAEATEKPAE